MTTDFVRAVLDAIGSASLEDVRDDVIDGPVAVDPRARHTFVAIDGALLLTALQNDLPAPASSGSRSRSRSRSGRLHTETSAKGGRRKSPASAQLLLPLPSTSTRQANGKNGIAKVTIEAVPPSIEDITNPDVLLAMLQGGEPTAARAPEPPAKTRARAAAREKTLNGILSEAPARKSAAHGAHAPNGASGGASNGVSGAASHSANGAASEANAEALAASDAAPVSSKNGAHDAAAASAPASESAASARPVSSGPRLRPGEEILRASAGGGAVIRRRRV